MNTVKMFESEGGRVLASFALLLIGLGASALKLPHAEELITMGGTLIARELIGGQPK